MSLVIVSESLYWGFKKGMMVDMISCPNRIGIFYHGSSCLICSRFQMASVYSCFRSETAFKTDMLHGLLAYCTQGVFCESFPTSSTRIIRQVPQLHFLFDVTFSLCPVLVWWLLSRAYCWGMLDC
jgi:hypothetical protein